MKDITLVIMAAGIGSRFGKGTKQLTPVGPSGELIIDYSIHDALKAGFNKVVFIIRKDLLNEFRSMIGDRVSRYTNVEYVFQEIDDLPKGYKKPEARIKPWGTGQAVLCCKNVVNTPFVVINADDYYGVDTYRLIYDHMSASIDKRCEVQQVCMAGFLLGNTLSDNGGVTRGVCIMDDNDRLVGINETKNIEKFGEDCIIKSDSGDAILSSRTPVSMNMWGFQAGFISLLEEGFIEFLNKIGEGNINDEFLLPIYIDTLLKDNKVSVNVIETPATWFGVTYQEDTQAVRRSFMELIDKGVYARNLYENY